ncbi:E3 ubiquitin-protein ligase At1g63170-like isoform X2 [Zingiber officinale]|uniref:E3 ubiquitin-protein ligase At1g63170-like isoform X2 n=1 Tax=Zingiber officinale TaxID=94328 RepID=UPI001C4B629E|nr:E3 ubiquitin-protein ligase At1g63170-like isoform X2 [Zingiber officinale]
MVLPSEELNYEGISQNNDASTSIPRQADHNDSGATYDENRPSTSTLPRVSMLTAVSPSVSNSINVPLTRRSNNYGRRTRTRNPLNSGLWISVELVVNLSQITAAIVVLSLSRHEHPQTPLFTWIIGYTAGCVATLPHLCWRYIYRNSLSSEQEPAGSDQGSSRNSSFESTVFVDNQGSMQENIHHPVSESRQMTNPSSRRLNAIVEHFKMALDCFFAVWFVVGNVWVFGGHSSSHDAHNMYRLCIVFLAFSCVGYALPFILCVLICCCLPCIVSIMGFREDLHHGRGASSESIIQLSTYKFKSKKQRNRKDKEINLETEGSGGILAAGTDKERIISAEDAVCCICLAKYIDNEELRELPCTHFFHKDCVDKWLKINALCPLCKTDIASTDTGLSGTRSSGFHFTGGWAMV